MKRILSLLLLAVAVPAAALEIRVHPGQNGIYVYETDARRGLSTALIQNLAVVEPDGVPVRLTALSIELRAGDRVRATISFDGDDLAKSAAKMSALEKAGALDLFDFAFQRSRYLGAKTKLASSETIAPGTALIMSSIPLLVRRGVDSVRIVANGTDPEGKKVSASLDLPLVQYQQKNDYAFPLHGSFVVAVGPGFSEPHRWALNEEFALDIVQLGASGRTCGGDCAKLSDYYAFGEDVYAVADGVVVSAVGSEKESSERLRQPGESSDAFMQRTMLEQQKLITRGAAGVAGNYVVIRHEGGEFSTYAHLAEGSIAVKQGDKVTKGQKIAKLGSSGNSTEPHLHFGISDGADPLYSRSLPVRFSGLTTPDGPQPAVYVQSGWIVDAK